jgi:phage-related protein
MTFMELMATLSLDKSEYDKGIDDAKSGVQALGSVVGKVASVGFKALTAAVTAAATGVAALTKSAVQNYAEYEQLVGGVETLFGTGGQTIDQYAKSVGKSVSDVEFEYKRMERAQSLVMENARNAYKTAGMSANEYMDQAVSMSASLIQGLGGDTEKAAKIADMAMVDMSDNMSKLGTSAEDVQNAYRGLSMGNFMMLDNLKLGYKGTAEEMARLINDSKVMGDEFVATADNVKDISYDKYIEAIHAVQEQTGIAGTTAKEASETIQGSMNMAKSSWENLVTAFSDKNADLGSRISEFVTSVSTVAKNIMPVAKQALEGVGQLVKELGPVIADAIPPLITDIIPSLLEAGVSVVQSILDGIQQNLPAIAQGAVKIATMLITSLVGMLPQLLEIGIQLIAELALGIANAIPQLIPTIVEVALQIVRTLIDNLPLLLNAAFMLITALAEGIIENIDVIIEAIPELVQALVDGLVSFLPQMIDAWIKLMDCLEIALPEIVDAILAALPKLMDTLVNYWLGDGFQQTFRAAVIMFGALTKALIQIAASLLASVGMFVRNIGSTISGEASNLMQAGATWFGGLVTAIANKIADVRSKVSNMVSTVASTVRGAFSNLVSSAKTWGLDLLSNFISGIKQKFNDLKNAVVGAGQIVANNMKHSHPKEGPMADDYTWMPDMMDLFIEGIEDNESRLRKTVTSAFDFKDAFVAPDTGSQTSLVTPMAQTRSATDSDLNELLSNLSINLYNTTEIDGQAIKKDSYKYTVTRMGDETRAVKVAMGGF